MRNTFGHATGVDEYKGGRVRGDEVRDLVEDLAHLLCRCDGLHFRRRDDKIQIEFTDMARIDDGAVDSAGLVGSGADQQVRNGRDWFLCGAETDAYRRLASGFDAETIEAFHSQRKMRAPLVACERMNLVDDERVGGSKGRSRLTRGAHEVERFGCGHHEGRRLLDHRCSLRPWRVARTNSHADRWGGKPHGFRHRGDLQERSLKILRDVDRQRLQRRDIDHPGDVVGSLAAFVGFVQAVDGNQESGQGLARSGWCGDQRVTASSDMGPCVSLRRCRAITEPLPEPCPHSGVKVLHAGGFEQGRRDFKRRRTGLNNGHIAKLLTPCDKKARTPETPAAVRASCEGGKESNPQSAQSEAKARLRPMIGAAARRGKIATESLPRRDQSAERPERSEGAIAANDWRCSSEGQNRDGVAAPERPAF